MHFVEPLSSAIVISNRVIPISVIEIDCGPTIQKAIVLPTPPFPIVPPLVHNRASGTIVPPNPPDEYINIYFLPPSLPFLWHHSNVQTDTFRTTPLSKLHSLVQRWIPPLPPLLVPRQHPPPHPPQQPPTLSPD